MFRFKRFTIEQDCTPMKVGTDGVLLGAWVALRGDEKRILDIGTGTGLIALMIAQRTENYAPNIDAVEIHEESAAQARRNILASQWQDRISVYLSDIKDFEQFDKYDLIVTNPPYFVDSLLSPSVGRTKARHTTELNFSDLVSSAMRLLKPTGRLAVILPVTESQIFDNEANGKLYLSRRCHLYSRENHPAKRYLSEYTIEKSDDVPFIEKLTIEGAKHLDYTQEYRKLTSEFYLKF